MTEKWIDLLSTAPLDQELIKLAQSQQINIEVIPFIHSNPKTNLQIKKRISEILIQRSTVVFTSINAVNAVCDFFSKPPPWKIYCMENATLNLVREKFEKDSVVGYAADATRLADKIISDKRCERIIFFCGNLRRDELPGLLQTNGIDVDQVIVYETQLTPAAINKNYDGILFFSPSGVDSFFTLNKTGHATVLFAIGDTTAAAVRRYSSNELKIAGKPSKRHIVEGVIEHFNTLNLSNDSGVTK